jgi:predicted nucleic acid-binding protein
MSLVLIDSSVWIAYFRGSIEAELLDQDIETNRICINELILSELLPLIRLKNEDHLADLLEAVRKLPIIINWEEIRNIQFKNLKRGIYKVGIPDLIIFQNAIQNEATLLTLDNHFSLMAELFDCKVTLLT